MAAYTHEFRPPLPMEQPPLPDDAPPPLPPLPPDEQPPLPPSDDMDISRVPLTNDDPVSKASSAAPPLPPSTATSTAHGTSGHKEEGSAAVWGSRDVEVFEKIEQIGEGTYGQVYMAKSRTHPEEGLVALKKVRMDNEREGFPITAIREIKILRILKHQNIVRLKEIVTSKATDFNKSRGSIYMVFEYMDHDLTGLMDTPGVGRFTEPQIKCYMKQLLQGLYHCHKNNVLHRDIKGSNMLINNKGELKLADFGLARPFNNNNGENNNYTNRVITLWYRPPELLLGATSYGPSIDMWSVGCILAELLAKKPVFPGQNEANQMELIFKTCGTPTESDWPGVESLRGYGAMRNTTKMYRRRLREVFHDFSESAFDLVDKLLVLDPKKRLTASDCLDHQFFWVAPFPCEPKDLPLYRESCHEFQAKNKRKAAAAQIAQGMGGPAAKRQRGPNGEVIHIHQEGEEGFNGAGGGGAGGAGAGAGGGAGAHGAHAGGGAPPQPYNPRPGMPQNAGPYTGAPRPGDPYRGGGGSGAGARPDYRGQPPQGGARPPHGGPPHGGGGGGHPSQRPPPPHGGGPPHGGQRYDQQHQQRPPVPPGANGNGHGR